MPSPDEPPRFSDHLVHINHLLAAALAAADPAAALARHWPSAWSEHPLGPDDPVLLLSMGKSSIEMAAAAATLLPAPPLHAVIAAVPDRLQRASLPPRLAHAEVFPADHPTPTNRSLAAARAIHEAAASFSRTHGPRGRVVALVSGGASAQTCFPIPPLTIDALAHVQMALNARGATIDELNTLRKHTEQLKGGRLARILAPLRSTVFIASDVIGNRPDVIASGPFSPDPTIFESALAVLQRRGLSRSSDPREHAVEQYLLRGAQGLEPESPKPSEPAFASVAIHIITSNADALAAAASRARDLSITPLAVLGMPAPTSPSSAARSLASSALADLANRNISSPAVWLAGGEPVVDLRVRADAPPAGSARDIRRGDSVGLSSSPVGGPSQELVLELWRELETDPRTQALDPAISLAVFAFSTDGIDGPTDAAGGELTRDRVAAGGGLPALLHALGTHDSGSFLRDAGSLIRTGATGVNVNHVAGVLAYRAQP